MEMPPSVEPCVAPVVVAKRPRKKTPFGREIDKRWFLHQNGAYQIRAASSLLAYISSISATSFARICSVYYRARAPQTTMVVELRFWRRVYDFLSSLIFLKRSMIIHFLQYVL